MWPDEDLVTKHDHEEWQNALDDLPQLEEDSPTRGNNRPAEKNPGKFAPSQGKI